MCPSRVPPVPTRVWYAAVYFVLSPPSSMGPPLCCRCRRLSGGVFQLCVTLLEGDMILSGFPFVVVADF